MKVERALISVWDKTGLDELVRGLSAMGVEIISTGGTAKAIKALGVKVKEVESHTGFPEMLDGRVKTLHPKIHAGLLALRNDPDHMKQLEEHEIPTIDMVVVNLYPFAETIAKKGVTLEEAIENIDIGGPAMLRSAAKNYRSVAVLSSPSQYKKILSEMEGSGGSIKEEMLKELAAQVFLKTSNYDSLVASYLSSAPAADKTSDDFPCKITKSFAKVADLRYGENPHQKAAFYKDVPSNSHGMADAEKLQGKELSFNNILDLSAALEIVKSFKDAAAAVVKHNNPCGVACNAEIEKAYIDALDCDRMSAFGGIMALNRKITGRVAELMIEEADFIECVIAPEYDVEALKVFSAKKNLRVLKAPFLPSAPGEKDMKKIPGGLLVQDMDRAELEESAMKIVTAKKPSPEMMGSLKFGWKVAKYVKSNAIVLCDGTKTVGIGAGQMSRVDSVKISIMKAAGREKGAALASDAFFPKADSIEEAHRAGIAAIIQPGGSIRDGEVIAACDKLGISMIFTGIRHFKH